MSTEEERNESSQVISLRQASKLIRKLHIRDNDLVLIKHNTVLGQYDQLDRLARVIQTLGIQAAIAVVDDLDDVKTLNETEMAKLGWYRIPKLAKIAHVEKEENQDGATEMRGN